jgi:hypothetical protein
MLDCCSKPSHDLGRQHHFETLFGKMRDRLVAAGVQRVILACPSCYAVSFMEPPLAANWGEIRRREADRLRIVTYCAGCAYYLGRVGVTAHLLDVIFDPIKTLAGKAKVSKAPLTYLNRLLLKRKFRKIFIGFGDRGG